MTTAQQPNSGLRPARPWWRPTRRDIIWLFGGFGLTLLIGFLAGPPTPPPCAPQTAPPTAAPSSALSSPPPLPAPAVVMPDLVGKTYTAGNAAIAALKIYAQVDIQEVATAGCTLTATSSLPIVRTEPAAGSPLPADGVRITLFVDRSAGKTCAPPPAPTIVVPPPGNTYINPPNVNLPNPNLPNLNPCKHTRWC